ncbi:MAG: tripartite tricarboxylate transporter substrate binding protein [Pseudomonadota bacterium]|nr:tripartite tricarboxylate transporter substrate binding protein [Pseudomonadota bacterium]
MDRLTRRRSLAAIAAVATGTFASRVLAEAFPSRPLHIVVPFPPSGTTDYVTRLVAAELVAAFGQPVIIDNKPGAGTVVGVDAVAKAAPDGYTLVTVANSFAANETLVKKLPYDGHKDLRPVALMGKSDHVLATFPGSGFTTLAELAAFARKNPGKLSFASFGNGTSAHLSGEMLRLQLGLDMVHVPYKGQAPALTDLLGGQVSMMFGNWPEFRPQIQAGKLVAIGMATLRRTAYAPGVPTLAEQGAPIESNSWNGLLAPAATPPDIVARLNAEVVKALRAPVIVAAFEKGELTSLASTPAQFGAFLGEEETRYAKVVREAHIRLDA